MSDFFRCFLCERNTVPDDSWDLESLKMIYGEKDRRDFECFKLCPKHLEYCEKRIPELEANKPKEPEKYILKKSDPKPFVPKIPVKAERSFYEKREPGEEG